MATPAYPIVAAESEQEQIRALYQALLHGNRAQLVDSEGSHHIIPKSVYKVLLSIVAHMQGRKMIALVPLMEEWTTKAAADFLGVSRQYLVRLLEEGMLPFHRTGTHRRIYFKDVLEYRNKRDSERRKMLGDLARKEMSEGTYDKFILPDEE